MPHRDPYVEKHIQKEDVKEREANAAQTAGHESENKREDQVQTQYRQGTEGGKDHRDAVVVHIRLSRRRMAAP